MSAVLNIPVNAERIRADRELAFKWFAQRLWFDYQVDIFKGVTLTAQRLEAMRKLIAEKGIADATLGRFNGREESTRAFLKRACDIDLGPT